MKHRLNLILFFILLFSSLQAGFFSRDISQENKPATIKILLHDDPTELFLATKGRYAIYNPISGDQISWGILNKSHPITLDEYGLYWGEKFPGSYRLRIVPKNSESYVSINGIDYPGCVEIHAVDGKLKVVNEVDIETFLKESLVLQFPSPLEEELMNAVAIVARTNLYSIAEKNRESFWQITPQEIPYKGVIETKNSPLVEKAVDTTRHAILTFQGFPFSATWTQNSAGQTIDFASIFRKAIASPKGVTAPIAAKAKEESRWSFIAPRKALAKAMHLNEISNVSLYVAECSEKVYAVHVSDGNQSRDLDFFHLQNIFGKNNLKSNQFTVSLRGDNLIFTGYGEGPGTGLCLYSGEEMAKRGASAPKILQAFFPDTKLKKMRSL